jgi:conjugal transfer/entry exclusion protein
MKRAVKVLCLSAAIALLATVAEATAAGAPAVVSVFSAKVKGDGSAYVKKLQAGKQLIMKQGAKSFRIFRAIYAGEGTSRIISVAEYENAEAFGKARVQRTDDAEFTKWVNDLVNSGLSEDVHSSLLEEVQP